MSTRKIASGLAVAVVLATTSAASFGQPPEIAPGGIHNGPGKTEAPPRPANADMASYAPTRPGQLEAAIDWTLAENERPGSRYYGRRGL